MTIFPTGAWRYAVLIIVLMAIVAVASSTIIAHLEEQFVEQSSAETIRQLSIAIWSLTLGCMFLSGALGLWAIRSTAEIEGRRRIGRFVDTMDYLSDGLLALDGSSHIRGANPAARKLTHHARSGRKGLTLTDAFPCLTPQDVNLLVDQQQPREVERECVYTQGLRTLRFRSQPSEGLMLILVSDITQRHYQDIRLRQVAQLQIIGRIAAGVAHDFNNILCAVAGHANLLQRFGSDPETFRNSVAVIVEETQKGSHLSRQLLELSRSGGDGKPSENLVGNVEEAASLLRVALSPEWVVHTQIHGSYPTVPLTPAQVEQVILNLGLLAADVQSNAGTITIALNRPGQGPLLDVGNQFAAVILVSGESAPQRSPADGAQSLPAVVPVTDEGGVITSVVRSLVEEAHGHLDQLSSASGLCMFRVCLPHLDTSDTGAHIQPVSAEQMAGMLGRWRVLLSGAGHEMELLEKRLRSMGTAVERKSDIVSVLAGIEKTRDLDALVLDQRIFGSEADSLLKAIRELCPHVGVAVMGMDPKHPAGPRNLGIRYVPHLAGVEQTLHILMEAWTAAAASRHP